MDFEKSLEAQFNPHFLTQYTWLIKSMADATLTQDLIRISRAFLFTSITDLEKTTICQDLNYRGLMIYEFVSAPMILSAQKLSIIQYIPTTFLLPLVENAIKYRMQYVIFI